MRPNDMESVRAGCKGTTSHLLGLNFKPRSQVAHVFFSNQYHHCVPIGQQHSHKSLYQWLSKYKSESVCMFMCKAKSPISFELDGTRELAKEQPYANEPAYASKPLVSKTKFQLGSCTTTQSANSFNIRLQRGLT